MVEYHLWSMDAQGNSRREAVLPTLKAARELLLLSDGVDTPLAARVRKAARTGYVYIVRWPGGKYLIGWLGGHVHTNDLRTSARRILKQ